MSKQSATTQTGTRHGLFGWWPKGDPGKSIPELESIINNEVKYKNDDYIQKRFLVLIKHYDYMSRQNSNRYFILQLALIITSALASFIVALEAILVASMSLKLIALLLTLLVAILGNYLTTFNVQAKWGAFRSVRESLITEFYKFYMGLHPYSTADDITNDRKTFATQVEQLIENANKSWGGLHLARSQSG